MYRFDEVGVQRGQIDWTLPGWPLADSVGTLLPRKISANDTPTVLKEVTTGPCFEKTVMFGPDSDLPTPVIVDLCPFPFWSVLIPISQNPYEAVLLSSSISHGYTGITAHLF